MLFERSAGPCLPGPPRLRRWSALTFYQLAIIAFQAIRLCFYVFRGLKFPPDLHHQNHSTRIWFHYQNPPVFKSVFKARKSEKPLPRPPTKRQKSIPTFTKNDFHEKLIFTIPSMRKRRSRSPKRRKFESETDKKMTWKQA